VSFLWFSGALTQPSHFARRFRVFELKMPKVFTTAGYDLPVRALICEA
jgi:hypothetical protein